MVGIEPKLTKLDTEMDRTIPKCTKMDTKMNRKCLNRGYFRWLIFKIKPNHLKILPNFHLKVSAIKFWAHLSHPNLGLFIKLFLYKEKSKCVSLCVCEGMCVVCQCVRVSVFCVSDWNKWWMYKFPTHGCGDLTQEFYRTSIMHRWMK